MAQKEGIRYAIVVAVVVTAILTAIILLGLASQAPDGFEWSLFEFAGIPEPEPFYPGIWSFLGEGAAIEAIAGAIGVFLVLIIGYLLFTLLSRRATV